MEFNKHILSQEVQEWLNKHSGEDINRLILKGSPFKTVTIQELANQLQAKEKCKKKLPTWHKTPNIYLPPKLSVEQSSSETTANYKANLVNGETLIDLTGGMGVDAFYFSNRVKKVIHCELNEHLSQLTNHNYQSFGKENITCIYGNGIEVLEQQKEPVDWLFIDPARRDDVKGKVFLFEDCSPNILELQEAWLTKAKKVLIKTSPMIDLSYVVREIKNISHIHVVAIKNEVKEILWEIDCKNQPKQTICSTINLQKNEQHFSFNWKERRNPNITLSDVLTYIYEPNTAILKSGATNLLENETIKKIHPFSHLFTSLTLPKTTFPGRTFKVMQVIPFNKKKLKNLSGKQFNVAIRNFKESPEQLKKKLKIKDGGDQYLFFTTNRQNEAIVIWCTKVTI